MSHAVYGSETWCSGVGCQHPACWNSCRRVKRGVAQVEPLRESHAQQQSSSSTKEIVLPTQKKLDIVESVFQTGGEMRQIVPRASSHRGMSIVEYLNNKHKLAIPPNTPNSTPAPTSHLMKKSSSKPFHSTTSAQFDRAVTSHSYDFSRDSRSSLKVGKLNQLLVQEVFELSDMQENWREANVPRPYYTWIPKAKDSSRSGGGSKKANGKEISRGLASVTGEFDRMRRRGNESPFAYLAPVPTCDLTDTHIPLVEELTATTSPPKKTPGGVKALKVKRLIAKSDLYQTGTPLKRLPAAAESMVNLLSLSPDVLTRVLDEIEMGASITRENVENISKMYSEVNISTTKDGTGLLADSFKQKKARLFEGREKYTRTAGGTVDFNQPTYTYLCDNEKPTPISPLPPRLPPIEATTALMKTPSHKVNVNVETRKVPIRYVTLGTVPLGLPYEAGTLPRSDYIHFGFEPRNTPVGSQSGSFMSSRTESDSASMNVTVSTDRSTLYGDILPGEKPTELFQRTLSRETPIVPSPEDHDKVSPTFGEKLNTSVTWEQTSIVDKSISKPNRVKIVNIPELRSRNSMSAPASILSKPSLPEPPPPSPSPLN